METISYGNYSEMSSHYVDFLISFPYRNAYRFVSIVLISDMEVRNILSNQWPHEKLSFPKKKSFRKALT